MSYYIKHDGQQYKVNRSEDGKRYRIFKSEKGHKYGGPVDDPNVRKAAIAEYDRSIAESIPL